MTDPTTFTANNGIRFASNPGETVNGVSLAKIFGTSTRTVTKWVDAGMPCIGPDPAFPQQNLFDSAACIVWRISVQVQTIKSVNQSFTASNDELQIPEIKRRKELAVMLREELALAKDQEEVVNIDYLMGEFNDALVEVRSSLTSMSSRLSGLISYKDEDRCRELIDKDIDKTLKALSEYDHECS